MNAVPTSCLQVCLDRLRAGDDAARADLLQQSQDRLRKLARRMLRDFPGVRRWEDTDDVFQNVLLRLDRMLKSVELSSARHYLRLAAKQIRRELIDLARRYSGPMGLGQNLLTPPDAVGCEAQALADSTNEPGKLALWREIHQQIDALPDEECEVWDLLYYQELSREEAAEVLNVSVSTVGRRWQAARLRLATQLGNDLPLIR